MSAKTKQFKIQRKKLVISKDHKDPEDRPQSKNPDFRKGKENKAADTKRASLNIKHQNVEFRRRSSSRSTFYKHDLILLQKKSTATSSPNQNSSEMKQAKPKSINQDKIEEKRQQFRLVGRNKPLEHLITDLINKLKEKQMFFHCQVNSFLVEKNYLAHIFEYLVTALSTRDLVSCNRLFHNFPELKESMGSICQYCESSRNRQQQNYLSLNSRVVSHEYLHQNYEQSIKDSLSLIEYYNEVKASLTERLKQLNEQVLGKASQINGLTLQINHKNLHLHELCLKVSALQQREQDIATSITSKQTLYDSLTSDINKIENYGCKNREMIRIVSHDYKEIESDIYQYAVYLQSNELASELNYEPHPFSEIEKTLASEWHELQQGGKDNGEAIQQMREFCDRVLSFHRKKDGEMGKLSEFKTKCIRQFIHHMKKWLANWELKQEFLVNLRQQFAIENHNMHQALNAPAFAQLTPALAQLANVYARIEENYKLGNSFY